MVVHSWQQVEVAADEGLWQWSKLMRQTCEQLQRVPPALISGMTRVVPRLGLPGEAEFVETVGQRLAAEYELGFEVDSGRHTIGIRFFREADLPGDAEPRQR